MSLKPLLSGLVLLATSATALSAPVLRLEAGYTRFTQEQQLGKDINAGGLVVRHEQDSIDSGNALQLGAEAGWSLGEHVEWTAGLTASYSTDAELEPEISPLTPGWTVADSSSPLDEMYIVSLRSGLRWQHGLTPAFRLHADANASLNQWRYSYTRPVLEVVMGGSTPITQFVVRQYRYTNDDRYLSLDATLGAWYAITPALDAVLDASARFGQDYRLLQYTAGLRYSFR